MVHYGTGALWDLWIISIGSCYNGIRTYHQAELKVTLVHSHYKNISLELCNFALQRSISQIPQCIRRISHNAPFCNRNVHAYAHFCYKMVHYGTGALWDLWIISIGSCYIGIRTYHQAEMKVTLVHSHYKNISLERYKQTRNTISVFIKNIQSFLRTSSFVLTNYERIIFCNKIIEFIRNVLFIFSAD